MKNELKNIKKQPTIEKKKLIEPKKLLMENERTKKQYN